MCGENTQLFGNNGTLHTYRFNSQSTRISNSWISQNLSRSKSWHDHGQYMLSEHIVFKHLYCCHKSISWSSISEVHRVLHFAGATKVLVAFMTPFCSAISLFHITLHCRRPRASLDYRMLGRNISNFALNGTSSTEESGMVHFIIMKKIRTLLTTIGRGEPSPRSGKLSCNL